MVHANKWPFLTAEGQGQFVPACYAAGGQTLICSVTEAGGLQEDQFSSSGESPSGNILNCLAESKKDRVPSEEVKSETLFCEYC